MNWPSVNFAQDTIGNKQATMRPLSRRTLIKASATLAATAVRPAFAEMGNTQRPNIVIFTLDDCDADSLGCFGCKLKDITPNLDALAADGVRFAHAHTVSSTCQPSRLAFMTGLDPQSLGLMGHSDPLPAGTPTLAAILRSRNYYTAIVGKVVNYLPNEAFNWSRSHSMAPDGKNLELSADFWDDVTDGTWGMGRSPEGYFRGTKDLIAEAKSQNKPFFLHLNTSDPHRPWPGSIDEVAMSHHPSFLNLNPQRRPLRPYKKNYSPVEIPLPGYLPDLAGVRVDRAQYLSAVHNADAAFGRIVDALREEGVFENTIIMCFSDQGSSFPMSKQSLYHYATNMGLIIRWPGLSAKGSVVSNTMISIVDIMPTILDVLGLPQPQKSDGKSFAKLLQDPTSQNRDIMFSSYNYARKGLQVFPMRSVHTANFQYIFNAWPGELYATQAKPRPVLYDGLIDPLSGLCWTSMRLAAMSDPVMRARTDFIRSRTPHELYDISLDPYCLTNLAVSPIHASTVVDLKRQLENELSRFQDPILPKLRGTGPVPPDWLEMPMTKKAIDKRAPE